jgi:hypothetical protein
VDGDSGRFDRVLCELFMLVQRLASEEAHACSGRCADVKTPDGMVPEISWRAVDLPVVVDMGLGRSVHGDTFHLLLCASFVVVAQWQ